jgi:hypothetical protein
MTEDDGTQFCFRCKGMAVINKKSLEKLPDTLSRASSLLREFYNVGTNPPDLIDFEEAYDVSISLTEYAIMIDGMSDD